MLSGMETRRWTNPTQPQTLQIAVFLFYIDAVLSALFGGFFTWLGLLIIAAEVGAAYGIANERRWGYMLGVGVTGLSVVALLALGAGPLALLFPIARLALLLHPQSREYERIWFK